MSRQVGRRKRRELLGGIGLAALGLVVLTVALLALHSPHGRGTVAYHDTTTPKSSPKSPPARTPVSASTAAPSATASVAAAGKAPLVVLNDSFRIGLAQQAMARFAAGGWTVTSIGNFTGDIPSTCAYYDPAVPGAEAAARAAQEQFPTIAQVAPKIAGLPPGPIVVVLTADYS